MSFKRKVVPLTHGEADLVWSGHVAPGTYEISGDPLQIRGSERLRGCFRTTVELAALAFSAGGGRMKIGAREYRVNTIAHTAGEDRVWFEIHH